MRCVIRGRRLATSYHWRVHRLLSQDIGYLFQPDETNVKTAQVTYNLAVVNGLKQPE